MMSSCQNQALNQNEGKPDLCDTAVSMEEIQLSGSLLTAHRPSHHSQGLHRLLRVLHALHVCENSINRLGSKPQGLWKCNTHCLAFFHALPKVAVASLIVSTGQQGCAREDLGYENMNITLCPNQV